MLLVGPLHVRFRLVNALHGRSGLGQRRTSEFSLGNCYGCFDRVKQPLGSRLPILSGLSLHARTSGANAALRTRPDGDVQSPRLFGITSPRLSARSRATRHALGPSIGQVSRSRAEVASVAICAAKMALLVVQFECRWAHSCGRGLRTPSALVRTNFWTRFPVSTSPV